MSDQINRPMLDNFDVNHIVSSSHHDIHKTSSNNLMKSIDNNSMQFVVSNRTEEFIDHSLLNPEYISTDISGNNFIIGLMANQDGGNISANEHYHPGNLIGETIASNDIHFSSSGNYDLEHERRLTATILQLVKNGSLRIDGGDATQLIITNNKDFPGLNEPGKSNNNIEDSTHFLTIEDSHNLTQLNDAQLKIFQSSHIAQQPIGPLPELTPIRRLSHSKTILNLTPDNSPIDEDNINQVQNLKEIDMEQNRYQLQLQQQDQLQQTHQPKPLIAKKVLPHKKRYALTKKLKPSIDVNLPTSPQATLVSQAETVRENTHLTEHIYQQETVVMNDHENIQLTAPQFSCQICGAGFHHQLDFFSHLKTHYEPIKEESTITTAMSSPSNSSVPREQLIETDNSTKIEPIYTTPTMRAVNDLNDFHFTNFSNVSSTPILISSVKATSDNTDHAQQPHRKPKKYFNKFDSQSRMFTNLPIGSKFDSISNDVLTIHNEKSNVEMSATINESSEHAQSPISQNLVNLSSELTTTSTILPQMTSSNHLVLPTPDETEFSDPEDMLEGIRGVVDKVQESDSEDLEIHSPKINWYTNSALNGAAMPRLHSVSNGSVIDHYHIYFKNDDETVKQNLLQLPNPEQQHSGAIITVTEVPSSQETDFENIIHPQSFDSTMNNHAISVKSEKTNSSDDNNKAKNINEKSNLNGKMNDPPSLKPDHLERSSLDNRAKVKTKKSKFSTVTSDGASAKIATSSNNNAIPFTTIIPFFPEESWAAEKSVSSQITTELTNPPTGEVPKKRRGRPPKVKSTMKYSSIKQPIPEITKPSVLLNSSNEAQLSNMLDSDIFSETLEKDTSKNIDEILKDQILKDEILDDNGDSDFNPDNNDDDSDENEEFNDRFKKPKKKYICEKCNKIFNSINALKYHDFSHTGLRPHKCGECGKAFFALNALKTHQRVHTGDKPFKCEECDRAFRQWGDLTYHKISLHSNKKDYQCEFCGKSFARKYSLVIHRRIHTGERNYSCEFCSKSFRASSYLQNHRKIHTGEKPYHCETCGKNFRVCGDLKRHTKIHEREQKLNKHLDNMIETEYKLMQPDNSEPVKTIKSVKKVSV